MKTFRCGFLFKRVDAMEGALNRGRSSSSVGTALLFLLVQCSVLAVSAQTTTSNIEGTVRDPNGAVVAGAQVKAVSNTLATERTVVTDANGFYRIVSLPAGTYTLTATQSGFAVSTAQLELTVNRTAIFDVNLQVSSVAGDVTVSDELPLLTTDTPATGATITTRQIQDLPVNGREYLDLLQLVPGVAINRQSGGDNANPVLGERSGNNNFFIDGQPNKDTVNGGPASQFNQETIKEFQVLTTGFKPEFGQASGAIVNVITKSGGNQFRGVASFFMRNDAMDSSNSLDPTTEKSELSRYDYSLAGGGPIWKNKIFFFGSAERIHEDRGIDFAYPALPQVLLDLLRAQEDPFDGPEISRETRNFLKLNQNFGRHQLVQEVNYTNGYTRGSGQGLPSTRRNSSGRNLLLGFGDTILLGDQGNPWITELRAGYRDEPSDNHPTNPDVVGVTSLNAFNAPFPFPPTLRFAGDLPTVAFGSATSPSNLTEKYTSFSASTNRVFGDHDIKFGWQFLRTKADGVDSSTITNQIFSTANDYVNFGAVNAGPSLLLLNGGLTPEASEIHLNNNYNAFFFQDDWKIRKNLTVSLGLRWDKDSEFEADKNFAPRLGVVWAVKPKTIIRSSFGVFYDQFRLGLVRQIPEFGGSDRRLVQSLYLPRLFYGSPSAVTSIAIFSGLPGPCISNVFTDAQLTANPVACPALGVPMVGVDRLNRVVAPGRTPVPANTTINIANVEQLTGLSPAQFLTAAAAAIGQPNGYFQWGVNGVLNNPVIVPQAQPVTVDKTFETPHTLSFQVGVQHELTSDMVVEANYYHREMRNLLGTRKSNLAFRSRVAGIGRSFDPPNTVGEINTFGPFFEGKYDGLILSVNKRLSNRFMFGGSYTYAKATDNSRGITAGPSDNFIGVVPTVVEPCLASNPGCTPQTNANGSFTSRNGNFVAQAGTFLNGPDLDKGPSSLSLDHIFQMNGLVNLPWDFQISGIFRAQSGFRFSRTDTLQDADGDSNFNGVDVKTGRNKFTAAPFVNADIRFSKSFRIGERVEIQALYEIFNLFNRQNPSAVQSRDNVVGEPFGITTQVLPGREGQFGFRVSF